MNEQVKSLLGLCYDSVQEISDDLYIVKLGKTTSIVNENNDTLFSVDIDSVIPIWNHRIAVGYEGLWRVYKIDTVSNKIDIDKEANSYIVIIKILDNCWLVRKDYEYGYGLINNYGELVIPEVCRSIYVKGRSGNKIYWSVKILNYNSDEFGLPPDNNYSCVISDEDCRNFDCIEAVQSHNPSVDIVTVSAKFDAYNINCLRKQRLRVDGRLVGKEYDEIVENYSLNEYGIYRTYKYKDNKHKACYTGLIDINGNELVECKYNTADYIGNGVFLVSDNNGYGTVVNGQEVIPNGSFPSKYIFTGHAPMQCLIDTESNIYYIGNDGKAYKDVGEAYPIYKSTVNSEINIMCLYGKWIYVDNKFRIINSISDKNVLSRENWIKL